MSGRAAIGADGASWSVGNLRVVEAVTMSAPVGSSVGLLGPNGSGKSSLLRMLAGLRAPTQGAVHVDGEDLAALSRRRAARRVALVEQEVGTDQDPVVADVIDLGRVPHRRSWSGPTSADQAAVAAAARATDVLDYLDRRYSTLSGGERQRVQIARALAQEPSVLLLDEPTNHLDVRHQLELLRLVRQAPVTVVMALHDLNLAASFCDLVVVLQGGRVVADGPPADVLTPELIEEVYGVPSRVVRDKDGLHVRFLC